MDSQLGHSGRQRQPSSLAGCAPPKRKRLESAVPQNEKTRVTGLLHVYISGCKGNLSQQQHKLHNVKDWHLPFRGAHHRKQKSQREQRHLERIAEYVSYQVISFLRATPQQPIGDQGRHWRCVYSTDQAAELTEMRCRHVYRMHLQQKRINQRGLERTPNSANDQIKSILASERVAEPLTDNRCSLGLKRTQTVSHSFLFNYLAEAFKIESETYAGKDLGEPEPIPTPTQLHRTTGGGQTTQEPNRTTQLSPIRPKQAQAV